MELTADSDAIITKGIIALLIRVFSNQTSDILDAKTDFIDKLASRSIYRPLVPTA